MVDFLINLFCFDVWSLSKVYQSLDLFYIFEWWYYLLVILVALSWIANGCTNSNLSFSKVPSSLSKRLASSICLRRLSLWKLLTTLYLKSAISPLCSSSQCSHKLLFFFLKSASLCSLHLILAVLLVYYILFIAAKYKL